MNLYTPPPQAEQWTKLSKTEHQHISGDLVCRLPDGRWLDVADKLTYGTKGVACNVVETRYSRSISVCAECGDGEGRMQQKWVEATDTLIWVHPGCPG